jgi:hypothetical protein
MALDSTSLGCDVRGERLHLIRREGAPKPWWTGWPECRRGRGNDATGQLHHTEASAWDT